MQKNYANNTIKNFIKEVTLENLSNFEKKMQEILDIVFWRDYYSITLIKS